MRKSLYNTSRANGEKAIIRTRAQALKANEKTYYTGKPCKYGHIEFRYTNTGQCRECKKERRIAWDENNVEQKWANTAYRNAKRRAKAKGLPFNLSVEHIISILPDRCPVFRTRFVFSNTGHSTADSPTIDRLDPSKGYVKDNIVIISMKANCIKSAYTEKDLYKVADWLHDEKKRRGL